MAEDLFINYFEFAGLDPNRSREENCQVLNKMKLELNSKRSAKAQTQKEILTEAAAIFDNEETYTRYRAEWEQRHVSRPDPGAGGQPASAASGTPAGPRPAGVRSLLAKALTNYIENKVNQPLPNVAGRWRDSSGAFLQLQQNGTAITGVLTDAWGNTVAQGQGSISGHTITYAAAYANGQGGQGRLVVSPDGNAIQGQLAFSMLGTPMGMTNVLLVRA